MKNNIDQLSQATLQIYLETARSIIEQAAELARLQAKNIANARHSNFVAQSTLKSDGSLVTESDRLLDRFITERLQAAFPEQAILSEEQNTIYEPSNPFTWVIDPIDGTTNFAHGFPIWGISLALLWLGQPIIGIIAFPSLHEILYATSDQLTQMNQLNIQVASDQTLHSQQLFTCCSRTPKRYTIRTAMKMRMVGTTAYHLSKVADGTVLASIEMTPKLWDIAAAALLITQAGGVIQRLDGTAIFPLPAEQLDYAKQEIAILAAASQHVLEQVKGSMEPR